MMPACLAAGPGGRTGRRLFRARPLPWLLLTALAAALLAGPAGAQVVPPPPPPDEEEQVLQEVAIWYVSVSGQARGPYSESQLRQMAVEGKIDAGTALWTEGMADWKRLRDLPELAAVLAVVPQAGKETKPPPAPNLQEQLDKEFAAFMVGTWYMEGPQSVGDAYYYVVVELTYRSDGSYAGYQAIQMPLQGGGSAPPYVISRRGNFKVNGIDDTSFVLTLIEQGQQPTMTNLEVIDRNTIRNGNLDLLVYRTR